MGYYADGYGSVKAKDKAAFDNIVDMLDKSDRVPFDYGLYEDNLEIDLSDSEKYHEEDVLDFLDSIIEFINEGEIEYTGEDSCHWKFVFDTKSSRWYERSGRVIYDLSELSDDELSKEMWKRGYSVQYIG